jgi:hypothetical protein
MIEFNFPLVVDGTEIKCKAEVVVEIMLDPSADNKITMYSGIVGFIDYGCYIEFSQDVKVPVDVWKDHGMDISDQIFIKELKEKLEKSSEVLELLNKEELKNYLNASVHSSS